MTLAIDLNKQQALDADPKVTSKLILQEIQISQEIQQCFLTVGEIEETILDFSQGTLGVL